MYTIFWRVKKIISKCQIYENLKKINYVFIKLNILMDKI